LSDEYLPIDAGSLKDKQVRRRQEHCFEGKTVLPWVVNAY